MVSIKKAKQGFSLRQRNTHRRPNAESIGLLVGGICVGFLMIVLWQSMGTDKEVTQQKLAILRRNEKPHPHIMDHQGGDQFNAVALDILETLECEKLFQQKTNNMNNLMDDEYGGGGGMNGVGDDGAIRRRLDEQHGDDGGFDLNRRGGGGGGSSGGARPDDDDDKQLPDQEEKWDVNNNNNNNMMDDQVGGGGGAGWDDPIGGGGGGGDFDEYYDITATHLFCLAATQDPPESLKSQIQCDATSSKRKTLLELWSSARAQMMNVDILKKTLSLATEHSNMNLLGRTYHLWAPANDDGLNFMVNSLNSEKDADNGGIHGLSASLGPNKYFVDVGSCLGITSLAVHQEYPGTNIISIEPAFPNWLYQELNVRCNLEDHNTQHYKIQMSGVGPNTENEDFLMAKLMWHPSSTTSTRTWTPSSEHHPDDLELIVRLQRLKQILAESGVYDISKVNVLNIDCEGCEYNVIPAMTEEEFDAIPTVMGAVHWGYIPTSKLPSSSRGRATHQRLCSHENIAKASKECCAFLDLPVKSSVPGEVLHKDTNKRNQYGLAQESTVQDVIGDKLCDDFAEWSKEHFLNDVMDDWGWMELSSQA